MRRATRSWRSAADTPQAPTTAPDAGLTRPPAFCRGVWLSRQDHIAYLRKTYPDVYIGKTLERQSYVLMGRPGDASMFEEVNKFRENHPTEPMSHAFKHFSTCLPAACRAMFANRSRQRWPTTSPDGAAVTEPDPEHEALDAVIKAAYRSRRADYVLKVVATAKTPQHVSVRAAWERCVRARSRQACGDAA